MIADRWQGVSPAEVDDWDEVMVQDALLRIELESAHHKREAKRREAKGAR